MASRFLAFIPSWQQLARSSLQDLCPVCPTAVMDWPDWATLRQSATPGTVEENYFRFDAAMVEIDL